MPTCPSTRRDFLGNAAGALAAAASVAASGGALIGPGRGTRAIDLEVEVDRVRGELDRFGSQYLPRLLAGRALVYADGGAARLIAVPFDRDGLQAWRSSVALLISRLPGSAGSWPTGDPVASSMPAGFLAGPAEGGWVADRGRIDWQLGPFPEPWPEHRAGVARDVLAAAGLALPFGACPARRLRVYRDAIRGWWRGLSASERLDPQRLAALLPALAEVDPGLVRRAVNTFQLAADIRADRSLAGPEREGHLATIASYAFRSGLGHAMARVVGALANNRFGSIGRFLDLPEVHGNWKGFMPGIIFAVLQGKVIALVGLTRASGLGAIDVRTRAGSVALSGAIEVGRAGHGLVLS